MAPTIKPFAPSHLDDVLAICEGEGWPSLPADPARAWRVLTAPGATTIVAVTTSGAVVGFAHLLSDGEIQAYLVNVAVLPAHRGQGVGRDLVHEGLRRAGGLRADLLTEYAEGFYETLRHRRMQGFRVYLPQP